MAETGIITRPKLAGNIAARGHWQAIFARAGYRVYPYSIGCMVRTTNATGAIPTHGKGEFAVNDYLIVCSQVFYGDSYFFIPDTGRISRVTGINAGSDDQIDVSPTISVVSGEWLFNLEADGAAAPTTAPDYDGSDVTLATDNAGNNANANKYLSTSQGGTYIGWVDSGLSIVDLLITDPSGAPQVAHPLVTLGAELVAAPF